MYKYEVGQIIEQFRNRPEGVVFDMADDGATLLIFFNRPTEKEIKSIRKGKIQFKLFVKGGIIFILSKFGNLPWMDAPYHVALSQNLTGLQALPEGTGYACHVVLVDSSTGEIKVLRLVGLGANFSKRLRVNIRIQQMGWFDKLRYEEILTEIFNSHSTRDMANYAEASCRIGGAEDEK